MTHNLDEFDEVTQAKRLGVSLDAVQLAHRCEVIDLHIDSFIPHRLWGYDWFARHRGRPWGRYLFGHVDIPRAVDGGLTGAMWSITTNVLRPRSCRWDTFYRNFNALKAMVEGSDGKLALVRNLGEYRAARSQGAIASMLAIQGANALQNAPDGFASLPDQTVTRVTLVHLTNSLFGSTSSPGSWLRSDKGLSRWGRELVHRLDAARCFVDLAHIHPRGFWDAVNEHDPSLPLIVTHTGVSGAYAHWRNIDDAQIRAIADSGGVVGIMFHAGFLGSFCDRSDARLVLRHMQHVIDVVGEDHVSIGSDFDGFIIPPKELSSALMYPRLVQRMLDAGWSDSRVEKVLGGNFLACFGRLRP